MNDQDKSKRQLIEELEELRRRVAVLQETEARVRGLIDALPLGVTECDAQGIITLANPAYERMTGYSSDELVGMRIADLMQDGLQKEALPAYFRHLILEQPTPAPYRCKDITKDGRVIDVQVDWTYKRDPQGRATGFTSVVSNITAQMRAEEALKKSEDRYRQLMDSVPQTVWRTDPEGNVLDCNRHWSEYTGQTPEEAKNNGWSRAVHPDDLERVAQKVRTDLAKGESYQCEQRLRRASDGTYRWHLASGVPIKDAQGRITGWIGSTTDIHDQKQAEAALQAARDELERRVEDRTAQLKKANDDLDVFRRFAEASGQGFGMADMDGRVTYMNPALCRMAGVARPQDAVGTHLTAYYPEEYLLRRETEILPAILQNGHWEAELAVSPAGKTIYILQHSFLIKDDNGNPSRLASVITDVTERKQAEVALQQSHDELRSIYDGMQDGLLVADLETKKFVRCNTAMQQMLGYSEKELLSRSVEDIHPAEEVPRVLERFRALADGREQIVQEIPVLRKDGSIFYADISHNEFSRNEQYCTAGFFRDITERKQAHEALMRQKELAASEKYARERAAELTEADRRKDEFLAMLAHELRNPLAPLRNGIDVLRMVPPGGEQALQTLDTMEQQAVHLVRLLDDLLDVSRCTRGKLELRRQRAELSKIVTSATQIAEPLIQANGHELSVKESREDLHLYGDPTRLTQVIANLLNNAAKFTQSNGKIVLTTERLGGEAVIRVKDNGAGIPANVLPRIFDMFVQGDSSLSRRHGGLGIGLTLVKSLVEMHGGAVEAASDGPGKGSQFTVRLPILQSGEVVVEEPTVFPDEPKAFPCHKILIVDDVLPAAMIVGTLLESLGQSVRTAGSGQDALDLMKREKPELVLADISMPEMDGYELAREIRRRPEWSDVYLVALTGYGQESDKKLAKEAGFNSHLVKPVSKGDLERLLMSLAYVR